MKKLLVILIAAVSVTTFTHSAKAQEVNAKEIVYDLGTTHDTAFGNGTKSQTGKVSKGGGVTVQYKLHELNDSCAGYVSVWGSLDNITFFPYPGADSVQITTATTDIKKGWFLATHVNGNPVLYIDVRTRLTTSYTVGKATVRSKVYPY